MSWESIGSTSTGQMPNDREWIVLSLSLAKKYISFVCGDAPPGSKLDIMWQDHEYGSYPSLGVWSDYDEPFDYIHACEDALEAFNNGVSWHELKTHFERVAFAENDEDAEFEDDPEGVLEDTDDLQAYSEPDIPPKEFAMAESALKKVPSGLVIAPSKFGTKVGEGPQIDWD